MKAVYLTEQGAPDVLKYGDLPEPEVGPGQVLLRVRAAALNRLDVFLRAGARGQRREFPKPHIPGCDIAGEVAALGAGVASLQVGQHVVCNPGVTCGRCEYCTSGNDNMCEQYRMTGVARDGGYAEYVMMPEENVHPIPDDWDFGEAAAIPLTMLTAYHMLITRSALKPGDSVLIMAAGSGVSAAALQICKLMGARVIATASGDEKLRRARDLGADVTINYRENPEFAAAVLEATGGKGVDIVFDHVGATVWDQNYRAMKRGGKFITCGVTAGYDVRLHLGQLFSRQLTLMGSFMGTKAEMRQVVKLMERRAIHGVVAQTFPLRDASKAHELMESREFFGKIVLQP